MALVKCPCFRLRRLAQNVPLTSGARHFSCKFSRQMALVTCPCACRVLIQKSCQGTSYRELVQRSCQETSNRDLGQKILPRDLSQRSCQQNSYRNLVRRSCQETSYILMEILYRDLVKRAEVLLGDHFLDSLNRDRTLRSLTKIFCGDLL